MLLLADMVTKKGDRIGRRLVRSITPVSADKIYAKVIQGPHGERLRQGEKLVVLCRRAWRVVHRLYPDQFNRECPIPGRGVTMRRRVKKTKPAVTGRMSTRLHGLRSKLATRAGRSSRNLVRVAAAPRECSRGMHHVAGLPWPQAPDAIKIYHHKTGAVVWHPLEETTELEP